MKTNHCLQVTRSIGISRGGRIFIPGLRVLKYHALCYSFNEHLHKHSCLIAIKHYYKKLSYLCEEIISMNVTRMIGFVNKLSNAKVHKNTPISKFECTNMNVMLVSWE